MDKLPKLLIATTVASTIKSFLLPYADYFRSKGWTVDAAASDASAHGALAPHFDKLIDIPWSRDPLDPSHFTSVPRQIREVVNEGGYDIVHVHTPVASFLTRCALRHSSPEGKPKIVYTAHGFHFFRGGRRLRNAVFLGLERLAGKWTDRLIVINREDYEAAKKYKIVPDDAAVYMPGIGLDFSVYSQTNVTDEGIRNLREELRLEPGDVLFTMIAEFIPRKRHWDLIQALSILRNPRVHVAFAGMGVTMGEMKILARELRVADRTTHFLGQRNDIPTLIKASRATILPSGQEGLARCAMESACLGVPMIGADTRGIRDVLQPCRGMLYPVGDAIALRDAIAQMTEEPHPPVEADPAWDIPNLIKQHEKLYEGLIS